MSVSLANLGFPRIGDNRELKKALENFWQRKISESELNVVAYKIKLNNWFLQKELGINYIPSNDFTFYDHVLDMAILLGAIPKKFLVIENPLDRYFAMARGFQNSDKNIDLVALEMTKWFDTNYHYIVPELDEFQTFKLNATKIMHDFLDAKSLGINTRPVIIGPFSFLLLAKFSDSKIEKSTLTLLDNIVPIYEELFSALTQIGVDWIQIDEPCLSCDLDYTKLQYFEKAYHKLTAIISRPKIMLTTYFSSVEVHFDLFAKINLDGIHLDLIRAEEQLELALTKIPTNVILSLGIIDGRNIWKGNLNHAYSILTYVITKRNSQNIILAPSCSLLHSPINLNYEEKLDLKIKKWLSFAVQKLEELSLLKNVFLTKNLDLLKENVEILANRNNSSLNSQIISLEEQTKIKDNFFNRNSPHEVREKIQKEKLKLPDYPTTTIGSFPQTEQVRKARANWRNGNLSSENYNHFMQQEIQKCLNKQEEIGLDVLVHGEFERNDMVEFFAENLNGFAFTTNGWVQSFGSRCVKPPIIYGDVSRKSALTVEWTTYAQSLTHKPLKGMLTGPVTILQWSFCREDQPKSETCFQIALALREEILELEKLGIKIIQVDEPAIREGLPLQSKDWPNYLSWAVQAFKLATSGVKDETQIHTHMCYSSFGDILPAIIALDADVISIEMSRSQLELFSDFSKISYPNEIGPGVYDIHSPRIPSKEEIVSLLKKAAHIFAKNKIWVNPDCGLKTRSWNEVEPALKNMVSAAKELRCNDS
ncbi:5-methyltetrahydropteroyltriglutamate--homocysteine S-methyltransferase [Pigmentibacter sp. JX0631]|uniref:5-methyltetrahydropteroyltriglutamate-- homocysteine S-methyltransferase n=1 Tax=Pigmentibacter sp. JX0631 TaxID=2976982 RepID=UPI002468B6D5|nr:5-methyltetrahydropteroyltriglutamate--homocysteine S-methyltransferase [Pigmentibacter sp. JX0631]WGL59183.1 5-methyltetrahydropteroyltriglutamate--homocysteine S-methyltransferase [Pigmentibacter sp. JX0631]